MVRRYTVMIPMDEMFLKIRVNGMYRNLLKGKYRAAIESANITLANLNAPNMVHLDRNMTRYAHDKIARALVKMAVRDYQGAHNYLRDLNYAL